MALNETVARKGTLYVVATPVGNLEDITLRALAVLKSCDTIAAEDTRVTRRLLDRYGITARLLSLHEHNEQSAAAGVVGRLKAGEAVSYVSDAGTPGVADPGARLVSTVRAAGFPVVPLPGANAVSVALSVCGWEASRYRFCGFLPARATERHKALLPLRGDPDLLVFYETPHRVLEAVADMCAVLGAERRILIARELTKLHESLHVCTLGEAEGWLAGDPNRQRGEFVLVVEGAAPVVDGAAVDVTSVLTPLLEALPLKQAVALTVRLTGAARNAVYAQALELRGRLRDNADTPESGATPE
jgi:16S rRNA (cytidine1402-2'-O)-methyltransferase